MQKTILSFLLGSFILVLLAGCTSDKYAWNNYDDKLYAYYKNPDELEKFAAHLKETIAIGERDDTLPPGIYAEYGYLLYEMQNFSEAIVYFDKERARFPESQFLMAKMINNSQKILENRQIIVVSQ